MCFAIERRLHRVDGQDLKTKIMLSMLYSCLDTKYIFFFFSSQFWIFLQFFPISVVFPSNDHIVAWVTRPERPKGAKDVVKLARRATN